MDQHKVAGLILASGRSQRFGDENKLLAPFEGKPLIWQTARAYLSANLSTVTVVVGHDATSVAQALNDLKVTIVLNPEFQKGQSRALVRGLSSLQDDVAAAVIGVGDQPRLTVDVLRALIDGFTRFGAAIVAPRYAGKRGNPVLFAARLFPELLMMEGDQGGRPVIQKHLNEVQWVDISDVHAGLDVDTSEDLERLRHSG
jgi:molybdenum cofactor cytidylyltransferase